MCKRQVALSLKPMAHSMLARAAQPKRPSPIHCWTSAVGTWLRPPYSAKQQLLRFEETWDPNAVGISGCQCVSAAWLIHIGAEKLLHATPHLGRRAHAQKLPPGPAARMARGQLNSQYQLRLPHPPVTFQSLQTTQPAMDPRWLTERLCRGSAVQPQRRQEPWRCDAAR